MKNLITTVIVFVVLGVGAQASEFEAKIRASFDAGEPAPTKVFKVGDFNTKSDTTRDE